LALLGSARTPRAALAIEPGWAMRVPMFVLAAVCIGLAAVPARASAALGGAVLTAAPDADVAIVSSMLHPIALLLPMLLGVTMVLVLARVAMKGRAIEQRGPTWGCGYPEPSPRMQYSSTSFGEPLTRVFQPVLRTSIQNDASGWSSETPDRVLTGAYMPIVLGVRAAARWIRSLRSPRITRSLLYVVATVLFLVALLFRPGAGR
jgi:hydrogenase-4 component B